jgi:hypothetical protein
MPIGNHREAFPDFDDELPEIDGFVDMSWHNEPCPCLINEDLHLRLFVDYYDASKREFDGLARYSLQQLDDDNQVTDLPSLAETDNLDDVLGKIDELRAAAPALR